MSKRISSWTGASLALLLSLVVFPLATPSVVLGQGKGNGNTGTGTSSQGQLVITTATVDLFSTVITITGQNFGDTAPDAFLGLPDGSIVDLTLEFLFFPTAFTAELPASIVPGNYLLIVRSGNGSTRIDSMDITIGAAGLQGIQGEQGEQGTLGPQGIQGEKGDQGESFSGYELKRQDIFDLPVPPIVFGRTMFIPDINGAAEMIVDCGAGKKAVGGGHGDVPVAVEI